jgi:hypothetical protein
MDYLDKIEKYCSRKIRNYHKYWITQPQINLYNIQLIKVQEDALSFITSIITTIVGNYWNNKDKFETWYDNIKKTIYDSDLSFEFLHNYDRIKFKESLNIIDQLNNFSEFITFLSNDILFFCIKNYNNENINSKCRKFLETKEYLEYDDKLNIVTKIDYNIRNFIMNILGIRYIYVLENNIESDNQKHNCEINNIIPLMINKKYIGYRIGAYDTINKNSYIGNIILYYNQQTYEVCYMNQTGLYELDVNIEKLLNKGDLINMKSKILSRKQNNGENKINIIEMRKMIKFSN